MARLKDHDEQRDTDVFPHVNRWAKTNGNDARMVDWDPDWVRDGWAEAQRYMESLAESDSLQPAGY